jgi:molybdate transport system substrate-binding protein
MLNRLRASLAAFALVTSCALAPATPVSAADTELKVFAAASLTDAFREIGRLFAAQHPDTKILFNFAGSQQLATQIVEELPADVFASANDEQMKKVSDAGLVAGAPKPFTTNRLAIAVEPGNPQAIAGLGDLARSDVKVILAAEQVPAGRYARESLEKAGVTVSPVSLEIDVRAVLSKIVLGEADAGIVYRSDVVAAAGRVHAVDIPDRHNVQATYPIAVLANAPQAALASEFVAFVLSEAGRAALARFGFEAPPLAQPAR